MLPAWAVALAAASLSHLIDLDSKKQIKKQPSIPWVYIRTDAPIELHSAGGFYAAEPTYNTNSRVAADYGSRSEWSSIV